jgi:hypothetical protein
MTAARRPARKKREPSLWVVEWRSDPLRLQSAIAHRTPALAALECDQLNAEDCDDSYYVAEYRRVPAKRRKEKP